MTIIRYTFGCKKVIKHFKVGIYEENRKSITGGTYAECDVGNNRFISAVCQ